ncbi:RNB domain-containing ribonuclease [Polynucleobacter sp. MWH-Berg-3C6]|uniref:RNB domain-containing ribonuclease n=1 Tax=Polynucleobacter sp. MWH-Berg-3C6 TaxID=1855882 RepID=UPI001C0DF4E4|nr:RNB domain-containing ribonuclease [Polynucleobacter sp. MWH-Berg-3C6]MBU3551345.1 RNB domain-containing ribonuclease [Polynucleobacter sp. MWH-Berg-3C6]
MRRQKSYTKADLARIAVIVMKEKGLEPDFSKEVHDQLHLINSPGEDSDASIQDLTELLWCSLDNDDSEDLDQLTACSSIGNGTYKIYIAVADVDALIKKDTPIDEHAKCNTASVYTSARIFSMLPEKLSTNLTSLNLNETRLALVTEIVVGHSGEIQGSTIYRAKVRNKAKLAYDAVSAWIEDKGPIPEGIEGIPGMDEQIKTQDALAQQLRIKRQLAGSLQLEIFQPKAIFSGEQIVGIAQQDQNRGRQLIEEFMIATNESTARYLLKKGIPSLRRVVRSPDRWARIVELAKQYGESLPNNPDSKALSDFLAKRHLADPIRFPDLSLVVVKLMGPGEYVLEQPGVEPIGHFGLAVQDYMHSTAPNRRFPDLITIRMLKHAISNIESPYTKQELFSLAVHCTVQEDAIRKVERRVRKSEAALFLEPYIDKEFDGVITGITPNYGWVRIFNPPAEGMLLKLSKDAFIGNKIRVKLVSTDVEMGHINFMPLIR